MEPAARALLAMKPEFKLHSLDVVGCGSTLGNLLRCAMAEDKPFRFDAMLVGETAFFVRRESSPTLLIPDLNGFGQTFPEIYTAWDSDVRNSCSHQRIIQYDLGGLQILIRTETDAYVKKSTKKAVSSPAHPVRSPSLDSTLAGIAVDRPDPSPTQELEIKMQGTVVPQEQIFDIKTRNKRREYNMDEILPRLWMNQTSKFLIAYHEFGLFDKPEVVSVKEDVLKWEKANSSLLARFHALVKRIIDAVRDSDHRHFEVSWDGKGPLLVTKQIGEERDALPPDLVSLWENLN
ncbi:uncharacterized protein L3040_006698 [Drepanopeziza brunnea f. sp. 'multigermtubi']|nr:hypothetical protein L3040_006698 [Drepanopeziza brunnea f. sp. 'multigermtubi']